MTPEQFSQWADGAESIVTALALVIAGWWALRRFGIAREGHPHIQFTADITFVAYHDGWWIVELLAFIENKGHARHVISDFRFDLYSMNDGDPVTLAQEFGQQVRFANLVAEGTWLNKSFNYFFIEPGVTAKYSHVTRVAPNARILLLHAWFSYPDGQSSHTAERTVTCPPVSAIPADGTESGKLEPPPKTLQSAAPPRS